jgi:hypothetical protein
MPTPLDQYASLTLVMTVPATATTNASGLPESLVTTQIGVAWIKVGNDRLLQEAGSTLTEIPLEGYFLAPQRPASTIRPGVTMPAYLWRLSQDFTLINPGTGLLRTWGSLASFNAFVERNRRHLDHEGQFTLGATLASQYQLPDQLLGKKLSGVFSYRVQWGDVV